MGAHHIYIPNNASSRLAALTLSQFFIWFDCASHSQSEFLMFDRVKYLYSYQKLQICTNCRSTIFNEDSSTRTWGKVANLSKPSMKQNSCREMLEAMIRRHMVNRIRLPSFLGGPKICWNQNETDYYHLPNMYEHTHKHAFSSTRTSLLLFFPLSDTRMR